MKDFVKQQPHWAVAFAAIFVAVVYWSVMATERYVSEATVVLGSPEIAPTAFSFSSLLSGTGGSGDLLLLREHLLSVDMLRKIDETLKLREHYSQSSIDFLSRMSADASIESFHQHYLKHVEIVFDEYSAVLRVRVQAYSSEMAHAMATQLLTAGEAHMNDMGQRLAQEQLNFIDAQVATLSERLLTSREALLTFQNKHGLVSPSGTVESIFAIVSQLQGQLALREAEKKAGSRFQSNNAAEMVRLQSQIDALKQQIDLEKARMAQTSGDALNRLAAEYETIQLQARFALELYSNSLMALENTRVEAARKLKQISVLQQPTMPEYAVEPRRIKAMMIFTFFAMCIAALIHLVMLVIRDHRD